MHTRAPLTALLAAITVGILTAVPGGPAPIDPAFAAAPEGRLVVTWRDAAPNALEGAGIAAHERSRVNARRSIVVAKGGRAAEVAARLQDDPRVASVVPDALGRALEWPDPLTEPADPLWNQWQADMRLIGMPSAWSVTTGSADVVVAVLDTGYELSHEDLDPIPVVARYNARTGTAGVTDGYGHGTHVAGTIAAATNNELGVASVAPGVTMMPVKVLDADGYGYWSDFLEGVDWAVDHGADVINMSLGSGLSAKQVAAWQPTFTRAWEAGSLVVAAAGNNNNTTPFYPASFANVMSVAATTNSDTKASFSNYGPAVDIAAPGVSIASAYRDNTYWSMSGTSMATPHVAGLAALIRSIHPEFTIAEVETALKSTALDLGAAGRDNIFGYGRIQAPAALAWLPPDVTPPTATLAAPLAGTLGVVESIAPQITFDEAVTGVDSTTVRIRTSSGVWLDAAVSYDADTRTATIQPAALLASSTAHRVVVGGAIADLAGNPIAQVTWGFTTGDTLDPLVIATRPRDGKTGVRRSLTITIELDSKVTGASGDTVRLRNLRTGKRVDARVTWDASTRTISLDPAVLLVGGRRYEVRILAGIEDAAGNGLAPQTFTFRTRD